MFSNIAKTEKRRITFLYLTLTSKKKKKKRYKINLNFSLYLIIHANNTLREECPNTEFFLDVRIFPYLDRVRENTGNKNLRI